MAEGDQVCDRGGCHLAQSAGSFAAAVARTLFSSFDRVARERQSVKTVERGAANFSVAAISSHFEYCK